MNTTGHRLRTLNKGTMKKRMRFGYRRGEEGDWESRKDGKWKKRARGASAQRDVQPDLDRHARDRDQRNRRAEATRRSRSAAGGRPSRRVPALIAHRNICSTSLLRRIGWSLVLLGQAVAMQGCTLVGPASIKSGRMVYSETITATDQEQMLRAIVRDRYEESIALLSVASVTANVSTTRSIGINAGFGEDSAYAGNLVPFSAGVVYEENPTISYLPVDTPAYLQ